jgi:hypothetical protein
MSNAVSAGSQQVTVALKYVIVRTVQYLLEIYN